MVSSVFTCIFHQETSTFTKCYSIQFKRNRFKVIEKKAENDGKARLTLQLKATVKYNNYNKKVKVNSFNVVH